jgi:hypothetical protein
MGFIEGVSHDALENIVIRSKVKLPAGRLEFEDMLWPDGEGGREDLATADSQLDLSALVSPHGLLYAPRDDTKNFQQRSIEQFIRELYAMKAEDVDLWLITETSTHPVSLRLKEIQYRVDAVRGGQSKALFSASVDVADEIPCVIVQGMLWPSAQACQNFII